MLDAIACPNHNGAFNCNPFCELCGGGQEVSLSFPLAFEYECWKCGKWHGESVDTQEQLREFVSVTEARVRLG